MEIERLNPVNIGNTSTIKDAENKINKAIKSLNKHLEELDGLFEQAKSIRPLDLSLTTKGKDRI